MKLLWHTLSHSEIFGILHSRKSGLSGREARLHLEKYGSNKLPEAKTESLLVIFSRQFQSPLIYVLLTASLILFLTGHTIDGLVVLFVLFFNATVGTIQEGKSRDIFLALKNLVKTQAIVLRDKKELIVSDCNVVPGDIIVLQEGSKIPADARLTVANELKIDESAFTGESESVHKLTDSLEKRSLPLAEQKNMVFKGTHVVGGKGEAIVVATGAHTEIGKISEEITKVDTEIPLKADMRQLSKFIILAVSAIISILFIIGITQGKSATDMFATAVALAISIIPEGLPIVMTLVLATGVWRMSKKKALIKRLQAVEALGQAKVIALDKTGTITKNIMSVQRAYIDGNFFDVQGEGYDPKGKIILKGEIIDPSCHPGLSLFGKISALNAKAQLYFIKESKTWEISGDPTEAAVLVFASKIGFNKEILEQSNPQLLEIPFDYKKKYRLTVNEAGGKNFFVASGAPETVLHLSRKVWGQDGADKMDTEKRRELERIFKKMSREGLRVVAFAINSNVPRSRVNIDFGSEHGEEDLPELTFVGFLGMKDVLREGVEEAVKKAELAGIRVVMITGDHKLTAETIGKEAGIYKSGDKILTGEEIDELTEDDLSEKIGDVSIFARVTPEHKLKIINAYRKRGEVIAMTGDGVNDAPSLVAADLGVAMGKIGTEVAKEASDIILLDDNFGSITSAIGEGRNIYKTIKRVILYLFSTGLGEVLAITTAILAGLPLPILPAQIIWLNLITDGFLDVALAMEPGDKKILQKSFDKSRRYLVDKLMVQRMLIMAIPMMAGTLFIFRNYFETDIVKAWSMSLTVLAVFQWLNAWNCRSEKKSIFKMNPFSNKFLALATITVILLQILVLYAPFMQKVFHTTPLTVSEWLIIVIVAFSIILAEEFRKYLSRRERNLNI